MALFKSNRLPLVALLLLVFVAHALAATYTVGDAIGWTVPSGGAAAYSDWASTHTFIVGDTLVFNFATGRHDVAVVSKAAYDSCSSNGVLTLLTIGPASHTLNSTGSHHFICTFGTHCSGGQKLAVNVSAAATSPSPSPRPAPSPPTMPPSTTPGAPTMPPSTTPGAPTMPPSTTPGAPTMPPSTTPGAPTEPPSAPTMPPSGSTPSPSPSPSPSIAGPPAPSSTTAPSSAPSSPTPGGSMGPPAPGAGAPGPSSGGTGTPSPSSATITRTAGAFVIAFVSISIFHRLVI